MITTFFYSFILFTSAFLIWISEHVKSKVVANLFLLFAFLMVFMPTAVRYDIGTDFLAYVHIYENLDNYQDIEIGFYFINLLLRSVGANPQWIFVASAFIFTTILFFSYPKKNGWILHFLLVSTYWFSSFNVIRQSIAAVLCLLAVINFFDERDFKFFILVFLGALFHYSALIIGLIGFIALVPLPNFFKIKIAPCFFISLIILTFSTVGFLFLFIEQAVSLLGFEKYASYFSNEHHFVQREQGGGLAMLAKVFFSMYFILLSGSILGLNKRYWLLILLNVIYVVSLFMSNQIIIFGRAVAIFAFSPPLSAIVLLMLPKFKLQNKAIVFLFLVLMSITFVISSFGLKTSYADPKINPYQSILN